MLDQLSRIRPVLTHIAVFILTLIFAAWWGTSMVRIVQTGIWQLDPTYQGIYVQAVADGFAQDSNAQLAQERLSYLCQEDGGLSAAFDSAGQRYSGLPDKTQNLENLRALVANGSVQQNEGVNVCSTSPVSGGGGIVPILGLLLIPVGIVVLFGVLPIIQERDGGSPAAVRPAAGGGAAAAPAEKKEEEGGERSRATRPGIPFMGGRSRAASTEAEEPASAAARGAQLSAKAEKTDFTAEGVKPPIVQFMTTYLHGDDLYDDSFSIETSSGEFLGETGVGISETISSGDGSKQVTAFEVWLFDKNDIRTVTKVIMSEHAFNDAAIRDKLKAKGDAELAQPGKKVMLETATMRVQARIVDMGYSSGGTPPNGRFERITMELAAWKRDDAS